MGRPPLPLGTSGKVLFATLPNGRVKARVKFRDYDGRVRLVSKVGPSRAAAERALKAECTSRQAPGGVGAIAAGTRMATLAEAWIEADHGWSTGTQRTYRSVVNKQVKPAFGQLCIREVTSGVGQPGAGRHRQEQRTGGGQDSAGMPLRDVRAGDPGRCHRGQPGP